MAKKDTKKDVKLLIAEQAMALSAEIGWEHVTLVELAGKCELSLAELYELVDDKADVLTLFGRMIDKRVLEAFEGQGGDESSPRDRLFDVMMERFDILNEYRAGLISVLESFCYDPKQAVISAPYLARSMSWMLELSGIQTQGIRGAVKVAGLTGLYLKSLRVWRDDASADMGKVMASLDKDLGRVEGMAVRFGL